MNGNRLLRCLVSVGLAGMFLGFFWLFISPVNARVLPPLVEGKPASAMPSVSASEYRQGVTSTIYLPMVMNDYPPCLIPPLNWATNPGGVLLRWRWPVCEEAATFRIYRALPGGAPALLTDTIGPVTDPAQADAILGDGWSWEVVSETMGIGNLGQLHAVRVENPMQAAYLANRNYRVGLIYGWGFSDTTAVPGAVYTYTVEAVLKGDDREVSVGAVVALAGGFTPLPAPTGLTATRVISEALVGSVDWVETQKNRKADRDIYLRWDAVTTGTLSVVSPTVTPPWLFGYDIYRAESPTGPFNLLNEQAIVPMPATRPDTDSTLPYELHDYFFVDDDPVLVYSRTYYYRAAPRDLLGQARDWENDDHRAQFSAPVAAIPRDTAPPPVPQNLTAAPLHLDRKIVLTWTTQATDTVGYRLYWSWHLTASLITATPNDPEAHWMPLAVIGDRATGIYTHTGITGPLDQDLPYWYRIRAVDEAGNLSAPSEPVHATLHDRTPPDAPGMIYQEGLRIGVTDDATDIFVYCAVDGGPYRLWRVLTPTLGVGTIYRIYEDYTPPVRTSFECQAQAVDANGNRSEMSLPVSFNLGPYPSAPPPPPVITAISTTGSVVDGWTAVLHWEAETSPGVTGFRVYRKVYGSDDPPTLVADEAEIGVDDRVYHDKAVEKGIVYSYTVAAFRPAGLYDYSDVEVHSLPRLYKVVPPLDCCSRPLGEITWRDISTYTVGIGASLYWEVLPHSDFVHFVVFRSLRPDEGYTPLTPPIQGTQYRDADAEHDHYWYVVVQLDWTTGEIVGQSLPWSAGGTSAVAGNGSVALEILSLDQVIDQTPVRRPSRINALAATEKITLLAIADTYVDVAHPDTNYGDETYMLVGWQSLTEAQASLVRFDLGAILDSALIHEARFAAYLDGASGASSVDVDLLRVDEAWDESSVTLNSAPSVDGTYDTIAVLTQTGWYTWEVADLVRDWLDGDNDGLVLRGPASGSPYTRAFSTRENGVQTPTLWLSYTAPPEQLIFGDGFTIDVEAYTPTSTLDCLSGHGAMALGGGPVPVVTYTVPFTCVSAYSNGVVYNGIVAVPITTPITVDYPGGFHYQISQIFVGPSVGMAAISLTLPSDIIVHTGGVPRDPWGYAFYIHPSLTFDLDLDTTALTDQNCTVVTPTLYFEMNPLPLRVVPTGTIHFSHEAITFPSACTQYDERYTQPRPPAPDADAGDGYLRPVYESALTVTIEGDGLYGDFATEENMSYVTAIPYGFGLKPTGGQIAFEGSKIARGELEGGTVYFDYYQILVTETLVSPPTPTGYFQGTFISLTVGRNGSLYGIVTADAAYRPVAWAGGGFQLDEAQYALYIPPIETEGKPAEDNWADWANDARIQPGLNRVTDPGESVSFSWLNCGSGTPVTFPDGVEADMYVRRGGVSDFITATIPLGSGVEADLYGYSTVLKGFRLSFCDNFIFDSDVSGDINLPTPAHVSIPLVDMWLNADTACAEGGIVSDEGDPLTLGYWRVDLHPDAVEFRDVDPSHPNYGDFPAGVALWILGTMDVPHLAPPDAADIAPIPLETSFKPNGTFHDTNLVYDGGSYAFDGFDLLLEDVSLSDWTTSEQPAWDTAATLGDPPCESGSCSQGFVQLEGFLLTPLFGGLESADDIRPDLQCMVGSDFVGFSKRPYVERGWTEKVGLGFAFNLLYAHDADEHAARFLAWDQETFLNGEKFDYAGDYLQVFEMDWAADIRPEETGIYFGLSTVPALVRALAETTITSTLPTTFTEELSQTAQNEWFPALGISETLAVSEAQGYLGFTGRMWYSITHPLDASVSEEIDKLKDKDIPTTPMGGGTTGKLKEWGVNFSKVRGQAAFSPVYSGGDLVDWDLEELHVSLQMTISWGSKDESLSQVRQMYPPYATVADGDDQDDEDSFIRAQRLTFHITRDGDYVLVGKKVRTTLAEDVKDIDFALLLNVTENPRFEGGLVLYEIEIQGVYFERVGAVLGVGEYHNDPFFYLGALGDVKFGPLRQYTAGGALLFGTIYTDSVVLREMGFADLLDRLEDTGETGGLLVGGYIRAYGDFPIYDYGCMFQVTAGGEVAAWYFAARHGDDNAWGGRLRGYVYGKLLCVVSARGDLTLEIFHPGHASGTKSYAFRGQFWAAGGIGWCEPSSWKSWESRWWGDKWCWCCGAMVSADYNYTVPDDWKWNYDADCE